MRVIENYIPKGANNPDRPIKPDTIVIHYSGGACVSAETLARCLINNNANNVSANYCVDEKDIICTIPPGYMSYGVTGHNGHIINIETCFKDPAGRFELDTTDGRQSCSSWIAKQPEQSATACRRSCWRYSVLHRICGAVQ